MEGSYKELSSNKTYLVGHRSTPLVNKLVSEEFQITFNGLVYEVLLLVNKLVSIRFEPQWVTCSTKVKLSRPAMLDIMIIRTLFNKGSRVPLRGKVNDIEHGQPE